MPTRNTVDSVVASTAAQVRMMLLDRQASSIVKTNRLNSA
jgi:hypothetical protein